MFLGRGNRKPQLDPAKIAAALGADSFEPVQGDPVQQYLEGKTKASKKARKAEPKAESQAKAKGDA